MAVVSAPRAPHLRLRRCLRCGFDGPEIQRDAAQRVWTCPACGEDLYARPARSYAELEFESVEDRLHPGEPGRSIPGKPRGLWGRLTAGVRTLVRRVFVRRAAQAESPLGA